MGGAPPNALPTSTPTLSTCSPCLSLPPPSLCTPTLFVPTRAQQSCADLLTAAHHDPLSFGFVLLKAVCIVAYRSHAVHHAYAYPFGCMASVGRRPRGSGGRTALQICALRPLANRCLLQHRGHRRLATECRCNVGSRACGARS